MEYLDNYIPQFEYEYYGWQKENNRFLYETEENEDTEQIRGKHGEIQS